MTNLAQWFEGETYDVEGNVRRILQHLGEKDVSREKCQAWVRVFISSQLPSWRPGQTLTGTEAQLIGAAFERYLARAEDGESAEELVGKRKRKSKR